MSFINKIHKKGCPTSIGGYSYDCPRCVEILRPSIQGERAIVERWQRRALNEEKIDQRYEWPKAQNKPSKAMREALPYALVLACVFILALVLGGCATPVKQGHMEGVFVRGIK